MENLLGAYIIGGLVYILFAGIVTLCADAETGAGHAVSTRRMAARMWLTIPVWPVSILVALVGAVRSLWRLAEWSK